MNAAKNLFEILCAFNEPDATGRSPQSRLLEYCTQVLGPIERVHVDFKEKSDPRDPRLSKHDQKNLAKAVSGFANTSGGVLLWGMEDRTLAPRPIQQAPEFVRKLLDLAPEAADPRVPGIDGTCIESDSGAGGVGFALIYIPESTLPPHRVALSQEGIKDRYFIRTGSSFVVAAHAQLADMFGRRPRPILSLNNRILFDGFVGGKPRVLVVLSIQNSGRGSAVSPFLAVKTEPYPISPYGIDGNGSFGLRPLVVSKDSSEKRYANSDSLIYPNSDWDVTAVRAELDPSQEATTPDLIVDYRIAAADLVAIEDRLVVTGSELWAVVPRTS